MEGASHVEDTAPRSAHMPLGVLLGAWFVANILPHLVTLLLTGKIYYQFAPGAGIAVEGSIMLLNLLLPLAALRLWERRSRPRWVQLGWVWQGRRSLGFGLLGYLAFLALAFLTQRLIADPVALPGITASSAWQVLAVLVLLLGLTALAEETMFRGFLQTYLVEGYGAWVGVLLTALLFGLRHLPMDLYGGLVSHASLASWLSRLIQLYGLALILGLVRHKASTWASWLVHEGALVLILLLGVLNAVT